MRAPKRKRPLKREIRISLNADLDALAELVTYVGSPEHKDYPSFAGPPKLRSDAFCCPRSIRDADTVTEWLRVAVRRGAVGTYWESGFPRYVWYKLGDTVFEARLTNRGAGQYKGYQLKLEEWPEGIEDLYGDA